MGLLGVLKAGGAYVPMDPTYPRERLDFMLQDSGAAVLLTHSSVRDLLPTFSGEVLALDTDGHVLSRHPATAPARTATAEHLAYVIYTSGSTGRPKGVMVQHRSVLNLHQALRTTVYAGQPSGLRVSVNAPLAFDAS
ncbi:AMP-binding protein, partial [Pyxidicoccus sp. 3LG]